MELNIVPEDAVEVFDVRNYGNEEEEVVEQPVENKSKSHKDKKDRHDKKKKDKKKSKVDLPSHKRLSPYAKVKQINKLDKFCI